MTKGIMQFGTTNDAGHDQTTLDSDIATTPGRPPSATLMVRNNGDVGDALVAEATKLSGRNGVIGFSHHNTSSGVYGENLGRGGFGIAGRAHVTPDSWGAAVLGDNPIGNAGVFYGRVIVSGELVKRGGGFVIDNPVDPASSYLFHSFVESPDMMNVYNGDVTTDAEGNASVELPRYFEALNRGFQYQLTVIGQLAQAIVAEEIRENRFAIKTDKPNVRVSWQVTGIRQDAWANAHRPEVETDKPDGERGKYLSPDEHGQPAEAGTYFADLASLGDGGASATRSE